VKTKHTISYEVSGNSYEQIEHRARGVANNYFPAHRAYTIQISCLVERMEKGMEFPIWKAWVTAQVDR
jgi:hypothetical protein